MAAAAHPDRVRFEGSQPILRVENMQAALRFYVDVLGFENADWVQKTSQASLATVPPSTCAGAIRAAAAHGSGSAWRTPESCTRS
jgi:catechol 2,3-dioxygenase-like lactoylglutathione lyase family enzyme